MPSASPSVLRSSGIPAADSGWGGFESGRTYLLVGHARSGRLRLAFQALQAGAEAGESTLLVSARAPETLVEQAAAQDFDLAAAYRAGHVRLLRVPAAADLVALGDDGLGQALGDLGDLACAQRPVRLVVDDFTAFVQFRTFAAFERAFRRLVAAAEEAGTTLILGFGEPANEGSRRLLSVVEGMVAGAVHVAAGTEGEPALTLVPPPAPTPKPRTVTFLDTPLAADAEPAPAPVAAEAPTSAFVTAEAVEAPPALSSDGYGKASDSTPPDLVVAPFSPDSFDSDPIVEAAPPDEAQHGGTEASVIRPIDPQDAPFAAADPFGQYLGPDLLTLGHFVDSDVNGATEVAYDAEPRSGLDGASASVHAAAYPEVFAPEAPAAPDAHAPLRHALKEVFGTRNTRPFLVLALRLDPDGPYADLVPSIAEALHAALGDRGVLDVDAEAARVVALLAGVGADAAPLLFEAVQSFLRAVAPDRADAALAALNALVVPNGQPFNSADELLAYVFEG